jgi:acyl carrier protein
MTKQDFFNEIAEIMQLDISLSGSEKLDDFNEWDSLAILGVISMFDLNFGITLNSVDLKSVNTFDDLANLAGNQISRS